MVKKLTIEDIKAQEEKLKKEQAKLRQQKRRLIDRENAEMGKTLRKKFGFKSFDDFKNWLMYIEMFQRTTQYDYPTSKDGLIGVITSDDDTPNSDCFS